MKRLHVLLIDANGEHREFVQSHLATEFPGSEIVQASSPAAIHEALRATTFDVVILGLPIAWADVADVAARVRGRWPDAPMILLTREGMHESAVQSMMDWLDDDVVLSASDAPRLAAAIRATVERRIERRRSREIEQRFHMLFDHAPVGICRTDVHGEILDANIMMAEILGAPSPAVMCGRRLVEFCGEESDPASWLADAVHGLRVVAVETVLRRADGTRAVGRLSARGLRDALQRPYACEVVIEDITRRRAERERLVEAERQLHHAQKMEAVGRLAGGVAHDFNNLLTVILGHASLVQEGMRDGTASPGDLAPVISAGRRATELTRQLLALSHAQPGLERVADPGPIIAETARMLTRLIGEDVEMVTDIAPSCGPVRIDAGQLGQVLMNLAVNARDAMPQGGRLEVGVVDVDLAGDDASLLAGLKPGLHARIRIRDTGHGIPEAIRNRIFEPFFTTKEPGIGTGLGLSIVFGIVRRWDGAIRVDSLPGEGSTFDIFLPHAHVPERVAPPPRSVAPSPGGPETILVTEDDDNLRALVVRALRSGGYHVLESSSGTDALELARRYDGNIHLLLSDVVMPKLTGPDLADRLREGRPHLRVLLMSGYSGDLLRRRVIIPDGARWLEKPFSLDDLARTVRATLDAPPE